MKTTVKIVCAILFMACSVSLFAQEKTVPKEILGKWSYVLENPNTGESYDGLCTISEKDNQVKALMQMGDNPGVSSSVFRPNANGKFYADMDLDGYGFTLAFELEGDKITCTVETDSFEFPIEMTRVK